MSSFTSEAGEVFAWRDTDRDGKINLRELGDVLAALGIALTTAEATEVRRMADSSFYGILNLDEFHQLLDWIVSRRRPAAETTVKMKRSLSAYCALPSVDPLRNRSESAAKQHQSCITDIATLHTAVTWYGDGLDERTFAKAVQTAKAAGAVVGETVDTGVFVDAIVQQTLRTAK